MGFTKSLWAHCPMTVPCVLSARTQNQTVAIETHVFVCCCTREGKHLPASLFQALHYHTTFCLLAVGKSTHIFINVKSKATWLGGKKKTIKKQDKQGVLHIPDQSNYTVLSEPCRQK